MGLPHARVKRRYDLTELGLLEGAPLKGSKIVTETAWEVLQTASLAFFVFDETSAEVIVHSAVGRIVPETRYPIYSSALAGLREDLVTFGVSDLETSFPDARETQLFKMQAMLAAPVLGPDMAPIGALVAFDTDLREWTDQDKKRLDNFAYLVTQEIFLRASFATIEIMSSTVGH